MPLSLYGGVFEPDDLVFLQRVFDHLCKKRRLAKSDEDQRLALAAELVHLFRRGVADEEELQRKILERCRPPKSAR
jgi:hypothetical protein